MDDSDAVGTLALVGAGRAGTTIGLALAERGWIVRAVAGRHPGSPSVVQTAAVLDARPTGVDEAAAGVDLVIVATPDVAVAAAARQVGAHADPGTLMIHLAGAFGLDAFDPLRDERRDLRFGALHPLVSIPSVVTGLDRLPGAWCAVSGDPQVHELATQLEMHAFTVADADRARYHGTAAIAANHLVALLAQVQRLADDLGIPFEAFLPLVRSAVENTAALGPRDALTGPVSRGDVRTVQAHLDALPAAERATYRTLAREAARLAGRDDPALDAVLAEPFAGLDGPTAEVPR
ncbi:MAG: hypothetical protein JWL73_2136 [Actinomycetia bacterium]|nr:hypothetical protein [Actinomycetes bacterium]